MNDADFWNDEYFIQLIERKIKHEIAMYFHVHYDRHPKEEEYLEYFNDWTSKIKCNVTDYDLGVFEDVAN